MNAINTAAAFDLSTRAMLVSFNTTSHNATKQDRRAANVVQEQYQAEQGTGRYTKELLDPSALRPIKQIVNAARDTHNFYSLPWSNNGTRILPADAFPSYAAKMQAHRSKWEKAVSEFCQDYAEHVKDAETRLGAMFDPADYPSITDVAAAFTWRVAPTPMPSVADFRMDISREHAETLQADMASHLQETLNQAVGDVYARAFKVVDNMARKLAEFKPATATEKAQGVFRDSLVENVRDIANALPMLNVTGDVNMERLADDMMTKLAALDADDLRHSEAMRAKVQIDAAAIADDLAAFMC